MRTVTAGLIIFAAFLLPVVAQKPAGPPTTPGKFDYYVLSLSWSPEYCAEMGNDANEQQCAIGRRFGFIVHGLWPENQKGANPNACTPAQPLASAEETSMLDIMPSDQLIVHEWGAHGSCSGLRPADFFKLTRKAWGKVTFPAKYQAPIAPVVVLGKEFKQALIDKNPGLQPQDFSIYCEGRYLREVRICMDRNSLNFRPCGARVSDACGLAKIVLRPVQ